MLGDSLTLFILEKRNQIIEKLFNEMNDRILRIDKYTNINDLRNYLLKYKTMTNNEIVILMKKEVLNEIQFEYPFYFSKVTNHITFEGHSVETYKHDKYDIVFCTKDFLIEVEKTAETILRSNLQEDRNAHL